MQTNASSCFASRHWPKSIHSPRARSRRLRTGFVTELAIVGGLGPRECLTKYGALIQDRNGTKRPAADADALGRKVSYWTDNGSAYWYRTETGSDTTATLRSAIKDLRGR